MRLTQSQVDAFGRDGFVFPLPAISAELAAYYRQCLQKYEAGTGKPLSGKYKHKVHLLFPWASELVHNADILDTVSDLIGPDILCWTTNFFIKEPESAGFVSWHQDSTYWGLDSDDVVTAWVALSDATPESGCMSFLPGSHKIDQLPHLDTFHRDNLLSRGQEIAVAVDQSKAVMAPLATGEMSLHHIKLVHGSAPNRSRDRRIGLAIRYIPTRVRQTKVRDAASLVRGVDQYNHFDLEPRPRSDMDQAAVAAHIDSIRRQAKSLYQGSEKRDFG